MSRLVALASALLPFGTATAAPPTVDEAATAALMQSIAGDLPALRIFLRNLPKGGDLHNHLAGAIYAEDLLGWAAADGLCVTRDAGRIAPPPCKAPASDPAAAAIADYPRYSRAIDTLSTRGFEQGQGDPAVSGADRFFATFGDFGAAYERNIGKAFAVAREQAAGDDVHYLELQIDAEPLAPVLPKDWADGLDQTDFAAMLTRLQPILAKAVAGGRDAISRMTAEADAAQRCGTPAAAPACRVASHFLLSAMRTYAPPQVFAQLAYGFALVRADPRVVGVNIVAPEHDPVAVRDYRLHMAMFAFLKRRYPEVPLSLHAGELALGMVPPRDLTFHIANAVAVAGARRIGHGVDIAYEDGAIPLLQRMAREGIAVEINLTSNAVILGVKGKAHPLALYRAAGVPVALATDDEGVSRTDMTNEYLRAVTEQGLDYPALKQVSRDSIAYSFVPGGGIWSGRPGSGRVAACATAPGCAALARTSEKAALELALEQDFDRFEREFVPEMRRTISRK